jgi:hypothetical protein
MERGSYRPPCGIGRTGRRTRRTSRTPACARAGRDRTPTRDFRSDTGARARTHTWWSLVHHSLRFEASDVLLARIRFDSSALHNPRVVPCLAEAGVFELVEASRSAAAPRAGMAGDWSLGDGDGLLTHALNHGRKTTKYRRIRRMSVFIRRRSPIPWALDA